MMKPPLGSMIDFSHPLSRGLVGCWLMNEGSGNRIHDISGNNNHGVLTNGPTWKPGRDGGALAFDGSNDYVESPDSDLLEPTDATFVLWIYPILWAGSIRVLIAKRVTNGYMIFFHTATNKLYWDWGPAAEGTNRWATTYLPPLNIWTMLGFTRTASARGLYVNGAIHSSSSAGDSTKIATASVLRIGHDSSAVQYPFNGSISSVSIYNRALSAEEIAKLYVNPYCFIWNPRKYWLMPQGVTIPPHILHRRAA